jgi:O-antigen ligase
MVCAAALAVGALLAAAVALAQLAGWFPSGWVLRAAGDRLYGNLGQANHLASYLFVGFISIVWLGAVGRLPPSAGVPLTLPILAALAFSGSRSVWLYFLAAIALATWFALRTRDRRMRRAGFGLLAALAVCVLFSLPWPAGGETQIAATETALRRIGIGATGIRERLPMWLAALEMFRETPFLGAGFGQYAWQYFLLSERLPQLAGTGLNDNAHNLLFHVLAELGAAGALIVAAGVALWLLEQRFQPRTPARWWMLSILAVLAVHSLLEYPLWYAYFLGLFALLVGAGSTRHLELHVRSRLAVPAMVAVAWFVLLQLGWDYRRIELLAGRPAAEAQSEISALHRGSLLSHVVELGIVTAMPLDPQRAAGQRALSGRVLRWTPAGELAFRHAILLALEGDARAAESFWKRAALAYPSDESAALTLLRALQSMRSDAVDELLEYAASRGLES